MNKKPKQNKTEVIWLFLQQIMAWTPCAIIGWSHFFAFPQYKYVLFLLYLLSLCSFLFAWFKTKNKSIEGRNLARRYLFSATGLAYVISITLIQYCYWNKSFILNLNFFAMVIGISILFLLYFKNILNFLRVSCALIFDE